MWCFHVSDITNDGSKEAGSVEVRGEQASLASSMILPYLMESQSVNTGTALFIITLFKKSIS